MNFLDLIRFQKPTPGSSPVDVRTNPGTYQNISRGVDQTLQRRLPTSFQGAGIQNAPMNILGQVSDISKMPPGAAREAARNQLQRNLQMADQLNNAGTPRPFGQGPGGSLRAPGIGPGGSNTPGMTFNPSTRLPGGGPFQRDYGMTRDAMRAVKGAGSVARGLKGLAQGGATAGIGYGLDLAAPTLAEEAIRGLSTVTGGVSTPTWLKSVNGTDYDIRTSQGMEAYKKAKQGQRNTPTESAGYLGVGVDPKTGQPTLVTKAGPPLPTAANEQKTGAWTANGWDPNAKRPTFEPPISDTDRFTAKPPLSPTQADLPPSSEQVAPVDPYAYQLSVYGQGRQAAANQEAQKKVADLGLAINRTMYPQFSQESYNPLMAATFPERYQRTPEDFVVQNGVQSPRTMINNTDSEALRSETEENNIYKMDVALDEVLNNVLNQARLRQQGG